MADGTHRQFPTPLLFVDHAQARGGAQNALLLLLEEIDRTLFAPHLATQPGTVAEAARAMGVAVHEVSLPQLRRSPAAPWRLARGAAKLARLIRREGCAMVHANSLRASAYAGMAALLARRPLVWQVHDILPTSAYVRWICCRCRKAIAVSRAAAVPLPCPGKVEVIHNGVRAADFIADRGEEAARLRRAWGIPADAILIGHVARLQPWKGQRDVIAAAELLRDLDRVYVAIIGGDIFGDAADYEREIKATVRSRGLADRVVLTGHQEDVPLTLAALDVVVHASHNEAFGRVLIEAAAAGVPTAAYASGAVTEVITSGRTGLLAPPGSVVGLAAALRRLATEPDLRRQLAETARREVRERFDATKITRATEEILASLCEPQRPPPDRRR